MPLPPQARSSAEPAMLVDINTTPLIDVMLVLLIMLIITIPVQLHSVRLNLPVPSSQPDRPLPAVVSLRVAADGSYLWNDEPFAGPAELRRRMDALAGQAVPADLQVRADPAVRYRHVAAVLAQAQRSGVGRLAVVDIDGG